MGIQTLSLCPVIPLAFVELFIWKRFPGGFGIMDNAFADCIYNLATIIDIPDRAAAINTSDIL